MQYKTLQPMNFRLFYKQIDHCGCIKILEITHKETKEIKAKMVQEITNCMR